MSRGGMAAVLASGPEAVLSHWSAAALWGIRPNSRERTCGGKRFQVDCHWPGTGQIVELDGWQGHKPRTAFREDRARDRRLTAAGYTVTHLTWNQLDDEPEAVASDLRVLLGVGK